MNHDPLELSVAAQTTEANLFSFSERPRELSNGRGTDFNHGWLLRPNSTTAFIDTD